MSLPLFLVFTKVLLARSEAQLVCVCVCVHMHTHMDRWKLIIRILYNWPPENNYLWACHLHNRVQEHSIETAIQESESQNQKVTITNVSQHPDNED